MRVDGLLPRMEPAASAIIAPGIRAAMAGARYVAVLTGAGISAESGLATFRDAQTGLWARFDPRELATPSAFVRNPKLVWDWYAWRRAQVAAVQPNDGHRALAELERRVSPFLLITQNVDGLHQRAGSRKVVELHGNIGRVRCSREGTIVDRWDASGDAVPRCAACGAMLRPDVVWFEEMLPAAALARAEAAARECDVLLVVGTSADVYPAAALPGYAQQSGATVIEINPNPTALSSTADHVLRGAAGVLLPALLASVSSRAP
jgi:NAD-dependent protein deacetylase/lipoamidase